MRRRYRRTTDLRPYVYPGILLIIMVTLGISFNSFGATLLGLGGLLADLLLYGWLVQGWRFHPDKPAMPATRPAPSRTRPAPISATRSKSTPPNLQATINHQQFADARLIRLMQMDGVEFERFVGDSVFKKLGYSVDYTPTTGDGGIDLIIRKQGEVAAVQCKRYSGTVDGAMVRDLNGVVGKGGFERGYLVTTGTFSAASKEWVRGTRIVLIDRDRLLEWLDYLAAKGL